MPRRLHTLFVTLLLLALQVAAEPRQEEASGLLWEINAPQLPAPSYLFGTIHSEDERVVVLAPAVAGALQRASLFVMEMEPTAAAQQQANRRMLLPAGQSLDKLLGAPLYQQTVAVMAEHGVAEQVTAQLKPWAVTMVLSMPQARTGLFLDMLLYEQALMSKKTVTALESADEQIDALDGLPMSVQLELLRHTIAHHAEIDAQTEALISAWLSRDLGALQRAAEKSTDGLAREVEERVQRQLIDERNLRMVERMETLMKKQGSFVAVGALHLPGEQGIIALLRQRGYTLRPIY